MRESGRAGLKQSVSRRLWVPVTAGDWLIWSCTTVFSVGLMFMLLGHDVSAFVALPIGFVVAVGLAYATRGLRSGRAPYGGDGI